MANRFSGTRARRKRQWIRETIVPTVITDGVQASLLAISPTKYSAQGFGNPTVVRIRGNFVVSPDQTTMNAQGESQRLGFGIITVREGTSANVPGPLTEPNEAWMYWRVDSYTLQDDGSSGFDYAAAGVNRVIEFDVKAMRVLRGRDVLSMVVENAGDSDSHMFVSASWSVLLQE